MRPLAATARFNCGRCIDLSAMAFGQLLATLTCRQDSLRRLTRFRKLRKAFIKSACRSDITLLHSDLISKSLWGLVTLRHARSRSFPTTSKKVVLVFHFCNFCHTTTPSALALLLAAHEHASLLHLLLQAVNCKLEIKINKIIMAVRSGA